MGTDEALQSRISVFIHVVCAKGRRPIDEALCTPVSVFTQLMYANGTI